MIIIIIKYYTRLGEKLPTKIMYAGQEIWTVLVYKL